MRTSATRRIGPLLLLGPLVLARSAGGQEPAGPYLEPVQFQQPAGPTVRPPAPAQPSPPVAPTVPAPATAPDPRTPFAPTLTPGPIGQPPSTAGGLAAAPAPPAFAAAPAAAEAGGAAGFAGSVQANLAGLPLLNSFEMFGDEPPLPRAIRLAQVPPLPQPFPPPVPGVPRPRLDGSVVFVPSLRGFKVAENQTPWPVDRVYGWFNYFTDVNGAINRRFNSPVTNIRVYRQSYGFEKTFLDDGRASFSLQMPVNTVTADSVYPGLGGTSTAFGDLTAILKYALFYDRAAGYVFTPGLAVTAPTGPGQFADAPSLPILNYTQIQPFVGYLMSADRLFVQGFSSVDVPTNSRDVTLLRNSVGVGYIVYRDFTPRSVVQSIAPTFEVHVSTPLNHRGYSPTDIAGTPDLVAFTGGLNALVFRRTRLAAGVVTPVTGPRPFDLEWNFQISIRFGRAARSGLIPSGVRG